MNLSDTQYLFPLFPATTDCAVAAALARSEMNAMATEAATHRDYLYKFAMKKVGDADLADDLVQDTLLAAIRARFWENKINPIETRHFRHFSGAQP